MSKEKTKSKNVMKSTAILLAVMLVMISLFGCGGNADAEMEYTFQNRSPEFGSRAVDAYQFDDFSIDIPSDWVDAKGIFLPQFRAMSDEFEDDMLLLAMAYPNTYSTNSNVSIVKQPALTDVNAKYMGEVYTQQVASANSDALGVEVSLDDVLYADLGGKDAAIAYLSATYSGMTLEWVEVLVPVGEKEYYEIVFTVIAGVDKDIIPEIVYSIEFN